MADFYLFEPLEHAIRGLEKVHSSVKICQSRAAKKPLFKGAAYRRAQNGYKFWFEESHPPKVSLLFGAKQVLIF